MQLLGVDALLFDLGGVVLEVDFEKVFSHMAQANGLSEDEIKLRFTMDEAYQSHERGHISGAQYFEHLRSTVGLSADDAAMTDSWNALFGQQIDVALDAIDKVRDRYPVYGFSNTNAVHQKYWEREYPRIGKSFDTMFVSSEIGLRKPDAAAFEHILKETSTKAKAMLFFDDTEENIAGALKSGLQVIHVKSSDDVVEALKALS